MLDHELADEPVGHVPQPERKGHVLENGKVGKESVALKNSITASFIGRETRYIAAVYADDAGVWLFETSDHS
jgi:hypothetical protein